MKIKSLLFILFVVVLLWMTGCSKSQLEGENSTKKEREFPPSTSALITVDNKEYEMAQGNYYWEREQGQTKEVLQTDAASPNQIAEDYKAIKLNKKDIIEIMIEDNPQLQVFSWDLNERGSEIPLDENKITAQSSNGRYIYEVLANWPNGEISYTFVVDVQ